MTIQTLYKSTTGKISLATTMGFVGFMTYVVPTSAAADECLSIGTSTNPLVNGTKCTIGSTAAGEDVNTLFGANGIFNKVVNILLFLVGAVSVIMLIVGGFRYVISAGDQNAVTAAKNTILYAIIGLIIAFIAFGAVNFLTSSLAPGA
jgi:cytochrome bd-type quinol oxidase subunit 2